MGINNMLISVVVPVYNSEKYLSECVDSILSQSYVDFELILVNDGSTDDSPAICDQYAGNDSRVIVIHKENGGSSDARNAGILAANGEYIMFVDSDDYIAKDSFNKIVKKITTSRCDIIFLKAVGVLKDGSYTNFGYDYDKKMIKGKSRDEVLQYFTDISEYPVSPVVKLIKRRLIVDNNLFFKKGITCEDLDHMIPTLFNASTFDCCDTPHYYYRCFVNESISNSRYDRLFLGLRTIFKKWYKYIEQDDFIKKLLAFEYSPLLWYYHSLNKLDKKSYKNEMKKYAAVMSTSKDKRVILVNIAYKVFGLRITSAMINYYYIYKFGAKR